LRPAVEYGTIIIIDHSVKQSGKPYCQLVSHREAHEVDSSWHFTGQFAASTCSVIVQCTQSSQILHGNMPHWTFAAVKFVTARKLF